MPRPPSAAGDEIEHLYNALDNRNETIVELERRLEEVLAAGDSMDGSRTYQLLAENKQLRNEVSMLQQDINKKSFMRDNVEDDLFHMKDAAERQRKLHQSLRKQIGDKDEEISRLNDANRSGTGEQYWLEKENLRLREMVQEFEGNEGDLIREVETLANDRYALEVSQKSKICSIETLELLLEEKGNQCIQYESEIKLMLGKCKALEEKETTWMQRELEMAKCHAAKVKHLEDELEQERRTNHVWDASTALSYGKANHKDQAAHIDQLRGDLELADARIKTLELQNVSMKREVDSACLALEIAEIEAKELKELTAMKESRIEVGRHSQIIAADGMRNEMKTKCNDLEGQLDQMRDELRASEERNSRYEEGYGLTEAIVYQKQLEADVRRKDVDRKRMLVSLGERDDKILFLIKKIQVLSEDIDDTVIEVNDTAIEEMLQYEESSLRGQNKELLLQVDTIETERNSLMKRMRENAAQVSEKGFRLLGLSSENMQHVLDFASKLKEGRLELPLNDISSELKSEVASLKLVRQSDLYTTDRLEREIEQLKLGQGYDEIKMLKELGHLRKSLMDIQVQNNDLQSKLLEPQVLTADNCDSVEGRRQDPNPELSVDLVKKIEQFIGEAIGEFGKLMGEGGGRECQTKKPDYDDGIKRDFEAELLVKDKELTRLRHEMERLSFDLAENDNRIESKITKSVSIQVDSDRVTVRKTQVELEMSKEKFLSKQQELVSCQNKVKRLQSSLQSYASIHGDEKRIMVAHAVVKELKACLEEKNRTISNYRARELQSNEEQSLRRSSLKADNQISNEPCEYSELNHGDDSTVSNLMEKLTGATNLLKEKETALRDLKNNLSRAEDILSMSNKENAEKNSALVQMKREMDYLTQNKKSMEREKFDMGSSLAQCKNQVQHNEETIESMSTSLKRVKTALSIKNEEISKMSVVEAEVKRLKSSLHTVRRSKEIGAKALQVSKQLCTDALEECEKLRSEVSKLRTEFNEARGERKLLLDKYSRARTKIKELKEFMTPDTFEEKKNDRIIEDLEEQNSKFMQENARLRGSVASFKQAGMQQITDVRKENKAQDHIAVLEKRIESITCSMKTEKHELMQSATQKHVLAMEELTSLRKSNEENQKEIRHLKDVVESVPPKQSGPHDNAKDELVLLNARENERTNLNDKFSAQICELEVENNRLRKELQSFSIEFFEDLEDLKFNYSEAKKKLAQAGITYCSNNER